MYYILVSMGFGRTKVKGKESKNGRKGVHEKSKKAEKEELSKFLGNMTFEGNIRDFNNDLQNHNKS